MYTIVMLIYAIQVIQVRVHAESNFMSEVDGNHLDSLSVDLISGT